MEEGDQVSTFVVATGTLDGEVRVNQVGTPPKSVANFRMATSPGWYSVAAWGALADQVPGPGVTFMVTGKLSGRTYESDRYKDAEGKPAKISTVEIVASTIEVIGGATPADDSLFE
jgi:single-stranded DNA-binding protein